VGEDFDILFLDKLAVVYKLICSELMFRRTEHLAGRQAQIKGHVPFKYHVKGEASSEIDSDTTRKKCMLSIYIYIYIYLQGC